MDNFHLKKLLEKVNKNFPEEWYSSFEFVDEAVGNSKTINQAPSEKLESFIAGFCEDGFEHLNFSVIKGEYIQSPQTTLDLISEISTVIGKIPIPPEPTIEQFILELQQLFKDSLNEYKMNINKVVRNLNYSDRVILFEGLDEFRSIINLKEGYSDISQNLLTLFKINLAVLRSDHFLNLGRDTLIHLIALNRKITPEKNIYSNTSYAHIISNKIRFLIRKIIYRYEEKEISHKYVFDLQENNLDKENFKTEIFLKWDKRCQTHYEKDSNHVASLKEEVEDLNLRRDKLTFVDYHTKTKYYKDLKEQVKGLEQTVRDFNNSIKSDIPNNSFDQFAVNTTLNYLENNTLSLKIEKKESHEEIYRTIKSIEELQDETRIKNYFPYLKYLGYLSQVIDKILIQQNTIQQLSELEEKTTEYGKYFKKLEDNYSWCRKHFYLSYQLPYKECTTKETINGEEYDVFLASSFILPIDYDKVEEEVKSYRSKLDRYKFLLETSKFILNDLKEIEQVKQQAEEIRQEVKGTERRTIEILGIFTALVIFASSFINVNKFQDFTPYVAFLFMFALGSSLALFVAVIIVVARGKDHFTDNKSIYITLLIIGVVTWVLLIFKPFDDEKSNDNAGNLNNPVSIPSDTTNNFLNKTDTVGVE